MKKLIKITSILIVQAMMFTNSVWAAGLDTLSAEISITTQTLQREFFIKTAHLERNMLLEILKEYEWNITKTARRFNTYPRKIKKIAGSFEIKKGRQEFEAAEKQKKKMKYFKR